MSRLEAAVAELVEALRAELAAEATPPAPDRLYTIPETCAALGGISRSALYGGPIARGELRVVHVGRRVFVPSSAIGEYIEERAGDARTDAA